MTQMAMYAKNASSLNWTYINLNSDNYLWQFAEVETRNDGVGPRIADDGGVVGVLPPPVEHDEGGVVYVGAPAVDV